MDISDENRACICEPARNKRPDDWCGAVRKNADFTGVDIEDGREVIPHAGGEARTEVYDASTNVASEIKDVELAVDI